MYLPSAMKEKVPQKSESCFSASVDPFKLLPLRAVLRPTGRALHVKVLPRLAALGVRKQNVPRRCRTRKALSVLLRRLQGLHAKVAAPEKPEWRLGNYIFFFERQISLSIACIFHS
jgi:hypothetical protein